MKIIAKGRGQGKTTELIKISAEKQIPIVCVHDEMIIDIKKRAKEMNLKIPEPLKFKELNLTQWRDSPILIDNADLFLNNRVFGHRIEAITISTDDYNEMVISDDKKEEKKTDYFEDKVNTLKSEADKIVKQLNNCRDGNEYIGRIKSLEKVLELIKIYDWRNESSRYTTGEDNHIEVATWEQNSNGEIKNHKRYIVSKSYDNDNTNLIEQELNDAGIATRVDDMFRPFEDVMNDITKMWNVFDDSFPTLLAGKRQSNVFRALMK